MKNIPENTTVSVREKQIGDTLCIIETAVSATAKETVKDKIKRLIADAAESAPAPKTAA